MASIPLLRLSLRPTSSLTTTTHHHHHRKPPPFSLHLLHPLKPLTLTTTTTTTKLKLKPKTSRTLSITSMATTPATDRLISSVAYFLPFLNGLQYGRFLFAQFPSLTLLLQPILPIFSLYKTLPFASFAAFFGLYLGVVRNPAFSHYVRFNAMQALVLDVLLVLPTVLMRIFTPGQSGFGFKLTVLCHNAVFVFLVLCFGYSWVCSILGRTPYLPFVADAAGRQLGG